MINEEKLDRVLLDLGHDDFCKGTALLREAVKMYKPGMRMITQIYAPIGAAHGMTAQAVERAMRHTIEKAWTRGDTQTQVEYFGYSVNSYDPKPTVSECVARLARCCRAD